MESIGFTCKKNHFFIANFHVLGLFVPKKQVQSEKNFRLSRDVVGVAGVAVRALVVICVDDISAVLELQI
jgi:hypothetical protein